MSQWTHQQQSLTVGRWAESAEWDKPRAAPFPVYEAAETDRAAQYLREHWNLGADPIPNLVELLEERGIKVLVVNSEENIDGLAAQVRRSRGKPVPIIVIRSGVHGERQRFNLTRELGHMVMDLQGDDKFREKAAQRFAGAFLMPAEALWLPIHVCCTLAWCVWRKLSRPRLSRYWRGTAVPVQLNSLLRELILFPPTCQTDAVCLLEQRTSSLMRCTWPRPRAFTSQPSSK
jgi:hypothetical protein